ncbi:carboxymuconolactone decarboxylase family protein [Actinomycetospora flava]|uniref:Carboxymuconolactone decarboxylase family protein n=1 Tax=Actinomycetospora flava TaxID=3129232 RepID=A0ABU8MA56_9PSEU
MDERPLRGRPRPLGPPRLERLHPADLDTDQAGLHARIAGGPRRAQARVPLVDEHDRLLGPFGPMLLSPRIGDAVQQVGAALRTDPDLPPRLRELAILTVAVHTGCAFEWSAHEEAAVEAGLDDDQLQALLDGREPGGLEPGELVGLQIVHTVLAGGGPDDELHRRAESTLGRASLAALVWLTGYYAALAGALAVFRPE